MVLLPHKYSVDYYHFHDTEPKARLRMHMHDNINFFKLRSMAVFLRMYIYMCECVWAGSCSLYVLHFSFISKAIELNKFTENRYIHPGFSYTQKL